MLLFTLLRYRFQRARHVCKMVFPTKITRLSCDNGWPALATPSALQDHNVGAEFRSYGNNESKFGKLKM